jgi:hypothetical protein
MLDFSVRSAPLRDLPMMSGTMWNCAVFDIEKPEEDDFAHFCFSGYVKRLYPQYHII